MQERDTEHRETPRAARSPLERAAAWVRRHLVWLLVASYAVAAVAPAWGVWMVGLGGEVAGGAAPIRFSLVMVGVLLFCGAVSVDSAKLVEVPQRFGSLLAALVGVWAPPIVLVAAWSLVTPEWLGTENAAALVVGLALAGAMPVANSAVAWTHQSGGALVWALGLVVISICLCPWVSPLLLRLMGLTFPDAVADEAAGIVSEFSGVVFIVWVLGPTLLGLGVRAAVGGDAIRRVHPALTLCSATALLLLNYANASTALPSVVAEPDAALLVTAVAAAASLPAAGALAAWRLARGVGLARSVRIAWAYSVGMKNTGLALGLASTALGDQPIVVLVILAVTLTQHAVAAVVHTVASRAAPAAADPDGDGRGASTASAPAR